jgi:myo-inositol 2-dehydrogenase / D-chiro-inositol 1-dehydrogenase
MHPDVELAGCCDPDPIRAQTYGETVGYRRSYSDIGTMLKAEMPDAIVMAVPPEHTCTIAAPILEKGLPVLLEKPPGISSAELRRLTLAAEGRGLGAQVAFNRRYMPIMLKALEILRSEFTEPFSGHILYEMARYDRWDPDFSTTAIHAFDAVLMLAGSPFRAAELEIRPVRQGSRETANAQLEAECVSGARVSLSVHPVSGRNLESIEIHAVGQSISMSIPTSPGAKDCGRLEHWRGDETVAEFTDQSCDMVERLGIFGETKAFIDAVRTGAALAPSLNECTQQVSLMEALRSRNSGAVRFEAP